MKQKMVESFFDFRGGLNTVASPDTLRKNELVQSDNLHYEEDGGMGGLSPRPGSRRMHETALGTGSPITGLFVWDSPSGKEIIAVSNGKFYHRLHSDGEYAAFTEKTPSPAFSTSLPQDFTVFRDKDQDAALSVYLGDGTVAYNWNGTTLSKVDGTASFPKASLLESYHTRVFTNASDYKKHLFWSLVGDGDDFTVDVGQSGGQAIVGILHGEELTAIKALGSSLLLGSPDSIARFTGYSANDVRLEQDTEGLSTSIGVVGGHAIASLEKMAFFLSDVGPYIASEGSISPIGAKIEDLFDDISRTNLSTSIVAVHKGRREIWFQAPGESGTVFVYDIRTQSWSGRYSYSDFNIHSLVSYEDSSGDEYVISGGDDGFIRHMDYGFSDDVLFDDSGGSGVTWTVEFPPIFFENGPGYIVQLDRGFFQLYLPVGETVTVKVSGDGRTFETSTISGEASKLLNYRLDLAEQASRFRLQFTGTASAQTILHGFLLEGWDYQRAL